MIAAIALTLRHRVDLKRNNPGQQIRARREDRVRLVDVASSPRVSNVSAPPEAPAPTDSTGGKA